MHLDPVLAGTHADYLNPFLTCHLLGEFKREKLRPADVPGAQVAFLGVIGKPFDDEESFCKARVIESGLQLKSTSVFPPVNFDSGVSEIRIERIERVLLWFLTQISEDGLLDRETAVVWLVCGAVPGVETQQDDPRRGWIADEGLRDGVQHQSVFRAGLRIMAFNVGAVRVQDVRRTV